VLKTHYCGDLRASNAGQQVTLAGWMHKRRDHGGLIFLDLRDRSGLAQIVVSPEAVQAYQVADAARSEYVLRCAGQCVFGGGDDQSNMPTGEVEVVAGRSSC